MENPGCPRRRRPVLIVVWMLAASFAGCRAQPVAVTPRWEIEFPPTASGKASQSTAVLVDGQSLLVSVLGQGADHRNPTLKLGTRTFAANEVGFDPVSRLGFYQVDGATTPKPAIWLNEVGENASASLQALTGEGLLKCRGNGWVKQVDRRILPLALLRVRFDRKAPQPGTPLLDSEGRVVGLVFQAAEGGATAYAIPCEAVHRVRRDICGRGGRLVRGWLGLSLSSENPSPQVVRVIPNSPAAKAGILASDVLLGIGNRKVSDYADAANAFFYLIPDQPVKIRLLRGVDQLEFDLNPSRSPK